MYSSLDESTLKPKLSKLYENANFLQITDTLFLGWALIEIYRKSMLSVLCWNVYVKYVWYLHFFSQFSPSLVQAFIIALVWENSLGKQYPIVLITVSRGNFGF